MFAIKVYKDGQKDKAQFITNYGSLTTREVAEKELAKWLVSEQASKNSDANDRLRMEYGTYTEPTDEQLVRWIVDGGGCSTLAEALASLGRGYDAETDAAWYAWPTAISSYRYDTTNYEVVELEKE